MTWRLLAVALAVVLAGCASSSPHAAASQRPTAASGPRVTASPKGGGDRSPTAAPVEPVVKLSISCRLPVVTFETGGDGISYQGGFITFPAGTYTADPKGLIVVIYPTGGFVTQATPALRGQLDDTVSPFFDAATGRWVPSGAGQASPDGSSYAYATSPDSNNIQIHVVNVAQATEKTFHVSLPPDAGAANGIEVEDYDGSAVYFVVTQVEQYPIGVWKLDVATGRTTRPVQTGNVLAVNHGYAWAGAIDPHDPNPPRVPASRSLFDTIVRVDLSTGAQTPWYYTLGRSDFVLGLATGGWPIVNVSDAPDYAPYGGEVRLVPEPHTDGESNGELVASGQYLVHPETDGDRTWFGSDSGVFLYTSAGGLQKVFAFPPEPTTAKTMSPAGFCR